MRRDEDFGRGATSVRAPDRAGFAPRLEKAVRSLNVAFAWLAGISLILMAALVVANTILRSVSVPIQGTSEMVGWLGALTVAFALGYTQLEKGHVFIDLLTNQFPPALQRIVDALAGLAGTLFFAMISWQLVQYGLNAMRTGQLSQTLQLAFYPLIFVVAVGFLGLTFVLFAEFLNSLTGRGAR